MVTYFTTGSWSLLVCGHYSDVPVEMVEGKLWSRCSVCWTQLVPPSKENA